MVATANRVFHGHSDLVLLCVAPDRLAAVVRYEHAEDAGEAFPHLYGPLNLDAVSRVLPIVEGADGFELPRKRGPCDRNPSGALARSTANRHDGGSSMRRLSRIAHACRADLGSGSAERDHRRGSDGRRR